VSRNDYAPIGWVTIDDAGVISHADRDFETTIRLEAARLIGRNLLDFTAPADRERCILLLDKLMRDGEAVSTVKRLVREDGSHDRICNRLSMAMPANDAVRIEIEVETAVAPSDWVHPAMLLYIAKLMIQGRRAHAEIFPASLFADPAWDILLAAYVCEAEAGTLTTADLEEVVGIGPANASRWMRALTAEGLLDYEQGDGAQATTFRLSCDAQEKLERFLSDRHRHATERSRHPASED
jgi:hypothetical protein